VLGGRREVKHAVAYMHSGHICNITIGRHNDMYVKSPGSNGPRYMFVLRGDTRAYSAPQLVTVWCRMHASVVHYNARVYVEPLHVLWVACPSPHCACYGTGQQCDKVYVRTSRYTHVHTVYPNS
jgi:hypothetical protein